MEHIQKKTILNNNIDCIYYVIVCENPSLRLSPSKNQLVSCYCKQGSMYLIFKIQQVGNRWNSPNVLICQNLPYQLSKRRNPLTHLMEDGYEPTMIPIMLGLVALCQQERFKSLRMMGLDMPM